MNYISKAFQSDIFLAHVLLCNFPIDLLFVRDDDLPTLIFDGLCDGGVVGKNGLFEAALHSSYKSYHLLLALNACFCRLSIAVPLSNLGENDVLPTIMHQTK